MSDSFSSKFNITIEQKSDSKSIEYRTVGNEYFQTKGFDIALMQYNKSLAFAKSKEMLALAYANRSAIYFEGRFFKECLENIKLALENGYPNDKIGKLKAREEKCRNLVQTKTKEYYNDPGLFKLSYPSNEQIPFIVNCIEMQKKSENDQGVFAKRNLKAGDVISIEDPVIHFIRKETVYRRCYNCNKSNLFDLIPCIHTASFMFCSPSCMNSFYLKAINVNEMLCDDVKLLSDVTAVYGGIEEFNKVAEDTNFDKTIFDFNFNDPQDPKQNENRMSCLLSLANRYKCTIDENACTIKKYASKKATNCILDVLVPNLLRSPFITKIIFFQEASIPLFAGILNHSCLPNVFSFYIGTKLITIVFRPIKAGEEIFISHFNNYGYALRDYPCVPATILKFKCNCEACSDSKFISSVSSFMIMKPMNVNEVLRSVKLRWSLLNKKKLDPSNMSMITTEVMDGLMHVSSYFEFPVDWYTIYY